MQEGDNIKMYLTQEWVLNLNGVEQDPVACACNNANGDKSSSFHGSVVEDTVFLAGDEASLCNPIPPFRKNKRTDPALAFLSDLQTLEDKDVGLIILWFPQAMPNFLANCCHIPIYLASYPPRQSPSKLTQYNSTHKSIQLRVSGCISNMSVILSVYI